MINGEASQMCKGVDESRGIDNVMSGAPEVEEQ